MTCRAALCSREEEALVQGRSKVFGTENIEGYKHGLSGTDRGPAWSQNAHGFAEAAGIDAYDGLTRFGGSADDLAGGVWWLKMNLKSALQRVYEWPLGGGPIRGAGKGQSGGQSGVWERDWHTRILEHGLALAYPH